MTDAKIIETWLVDAEINNLRDRILCQYMLEQYAKWYVNKSRDPLICTDPNCTCPACVIA